MSGASPGRTRLFILAVGVALTLLAAAACPFQPRFLRLLDHRFYDAMLRAGPAKAPTGKVVVVDLDEASLAAYGQWPWPRYRVALLLGRLRRLGAAAVGLDIVFAEPDRTSPGVLRREMKRDLGLDVTFKGLPAGLSDYDAVLAGVLAKGPYALGYEFLFRPGEAPASVCSPPPLKVAMLRAPGAAEPGSLLFQPVGLACNRPVLARAAPAAGFMNALPDADGTLRRTPLLMSWRGRLYPSLALATLMLAKGGSQAVLKAGPNGVEALRAAGRVIPLDPRGNLLLRFRGPGGAFQHISAAAVLNGSAPPDALRGKIVFVGTSAAGLGDLRTTPMGPAYPGVEVHATVVDNIIAGDFLRRPGWAPGLELMLVLLTGLMATALLAWSRPWSGLVFTLLAGAGLAWGAWWCLRAYGLHLSPLMPLLNLAALFAVLSLLKYWREESQKRFLYHAFSHYVSKAVVEQIVSSPERLSLAGEERQVSIMFSDIRGFTTLSEGLSPSQVGDLLRDYFTPMSDIVTGHQGTLDSYIGDAIMAFWNAPLETPGHQCQALAAGLKMQRVLTELNLDFKRRLGIELAIGVGLHCGRVRAGNMGSRDLFHYTIIGDNVNLASRIEGLTKFYGLPILLSQEIKEACPQDFLFQEVDRVRVKGKSRPALLYTAYEAERAAELGPELKAHAEAMDLYQRGEFGPACQAFEGLYKMRPLLLYQRYQERCARLVEAPPDPDWDLVIDHEHK